MIYIITGAPCSGKSKYVREHCGDKDIVYDYDRILRAVTNRENHSTALHAAHKFIISFRYDIISRLKAGAEEINDSYIISTLQADILADNLGNAKHEIVEMDATRQECHTRCDADESRPDKEEWHKRIDEWYDAKEKSELTDKSDKGEKNCNMNRSNLCERAFTYETRAVEPEADGGERELWVEGYAVRFNSPTVLFNLCGNDYSEQIDSRAFDEANMTDVIFNYNHEGKVVARTRNKTLQLELRNDGLFIRARLDGTEEGRKLYDEISGGYIDRMSFCFTIAEESYNKDTRTWTVLKIKRLYDVSAVSFPAYDDTSIEARKRSITEAEAGETARTAAAELLRQRLKIRNQIHLNS